LPLGYIPHVAGENLEPAPKACEQDWRRQQIYSCRSQLDREWQAIEAYADLGNRWGILVCQLKVRHDGLRPLYEEFHRSIMGESFQLWEVFEIGQSQGLHRKLVFSAQMQPFPTGH
jgi:hypothetical protein